MNEEDPPFTEIFIGRQPIFDHHMDVYAYELLFRGGNKEDAGIVDGDQATRQLILNTCAEIGLESVVGSKLAFINLTRNNILNFPPLPKEKVVLEILESVEIDDLLIQAIQQLHEQGFKLALDDFEYDDKWMPLLEMADIIKIDVMSLDRNQIQKHAEQLSHYGVKLLAEKIETHEEYKFCQEIGFSYFQGYFLSKPKVVKGRKTSTNKMVVMQLLSKLSDSKSTVSDLEKILSKDPILSFKLLKIINSAAYAKTQEIESLQQAVIYLGREKLKEWGNIIALSSIDGKPHELIITTMVRAKMCALIAEKYNKPNINSYFTCGLFSTLDALMDDDLINLLSQLPIIEEIKIALINKTGSIGKVLESVIAYEQGDWDKILDDGSIDYCQVYLESIDWANQTCRVLSR